MRNKHHSNRFKRARELAKAILANHPWVAYDVKNHRKSITLDGKRYTITAQQLVLSDQCQRKLYQRLKHA